MYFWINRWASLTRMHKKSRSLQLFWFANSASHYTTKYLQTISKNPEASAWNKLSGFIIIFVPDITQQRYGRECQTFFHVFLSGHTTESQHSQLQKENDWAKEKSIGVCVWHFQDKENPLMAWTYFILIGIGCITEIWHPIMWIPDGS